MKVDHQRGEGTTQGMHPSSEVRLSIKTWNLGWLQWSVGTPLKVHGWFT